MSAGGAAGPRGDALSTTLAMVITVIVMVVIVIVVVGYNNRVVKGKGSVLPWP